MDNTNTKRNVIGSLIALGIFAVIFVAASVLTEPSVSSRIYKSYTQDTRVAAFYCFSFSMEFTSEPEIYSFYPVPRWDFWPTAFHRVEYVMEFPPEEERRWAVIYIKPDETMSKYDIDRLNRIISDDPGIEIDKRLTLPLTAEQIVSCPDAVLDIIKQLDREQWERLYPGEKITRPEAEMLARQAGIEVPV